MAKIPEKEKNYLRKRVKIWKTSWAEWTYSKIKQVFERKFKTR